MKSKKPITNLKAISGSHPSQDFQQYQQGQKYLVRLSL
jgi:hypothetical protein